MADEKLNLGPDEVNTAEPEAAEQATGDSPPEATAPEPEQAEPGMDGPSAGEPPVRSMNRTPPAIHRSRRQMPRKWNSRK